MKWLMLCLPLFACKPSCEEQGGHWVQDGWYYVQHTIGNVTYTQPYPIFVCKKEEKK